MPHEGAATLRDALTRLAREAWAEHARAEAGELPHLVAPSMPILYFGDSRRFAASPRRIVTVGLNPSRLEFPGAAPFARFPNGDMLDGSDREAYLASLDAYFRTAPYRGWFDPSFESILNGLHASYYDGAPSAALHTDLCSPLATDPTWSRLPGHEQSALTATGHALWHGLVDVLEPDVVLISIRQRLLDRIAFPATAQATDFHVISGPRRARPYVVTAFRRRLSSGKEALFVFGRASQTPFGSIAATDKLQLGTRIAEELDA